MPTSTAAGLTALVCLDASGLVVFVIYYVRAFQAAGQHYQYSTPLTAMWAGLGTMAYTTLYLAWHSANSRSMGRDDDRKAAVYGWIFFSGLFALQGVVSLVGWALTPEEGAAAGLSSLWIVSGAIGAFLSMLSLDAADASSGEEKVFPLSRRSLDALPM